MKIERFSIGVGDRFAHQARAQLEAVRKASEQGVEITPVWNKSYREHQIIGSDPAQTRREADRAVKDSGWRGDYFVDADHINLDTVDFFLESCDFFTIDVADFIGRNSDPGPVDEFVKKFKPFAGSHRLPGSDLQLDISEEQIRAAAEKYMYAIRQAGEINRHIEKRKGKDTFVTEVSMDETDTPQTPVELFLILAGLADEGIPLQTIAPKFSGRFNKGVDYVGDPERFSSEFEFDVLVLKWAVLTFKLPENLKLSIHSGSDKFSLYGPVSRIIAKHEAGLHLKTAGTTWLEELIGLAESGGQALELAKEIYRISLDHLEDLCRPYASVIDIRSDSLPRTDEVEGWDGERYARTLRHIRDDAFYNPHFRQLLHVGYRTAAQLGDRYTEALRRNEAVIAGNVTGNLYERHIKPLFLA